MRALLFTILLFASGCSTISQMNETLQQASLVIEQNTQRMAEEGKVIAENTKKIREFTLPMKFALPAFFLAMFIFNYVFFKKILRKLR